MRKWLYADGEVISCTEKVKVLEENIEEIEQIVQDAVDDAVIMGHDLESYKIILIELINSIESDF